MHNMDDEANKADSPRRRAFLKQAGAALGRVGLIGGMLAGFGSFRGSEAPLQGERGRLGVLRPPGAGPEADFLALCIRCTRCADACEAQCIRYFGPEAGRHQGTPYLIPDERGCTMCLACGEACPADALKPLSVMSEVAMGTAVVDERLCVSHNGTGVCGACHTACPLKNRAITQDFRNAPVIHPEHCTGCGLCEEVCIVRDRRAIQVKTRRRM